MFALYTKECLLWRDESRVPAVVVRRVIGSTQPILTQRRWIDRVVREA
jgi:hypothetical protein